MGYMVIFACQGFSPSESLVLFISTHSYKVMARNGEAGRWIQNNEMSTLNQAPHPPPSFFPFFLPFPPSSFIQ